MKKLFKPASLLFYLLCVLTFFFVGVYYAGLTGKAENQGLAGGAIILGNGVIFAVVSLIVSFFFVFYRYNWVGRVNRILIAVLVLFLVLTTWRFMQREREEESQFPIQPTRPKTEASIAPWSTVDDQNDHPMGLGMFKPHFHKDSMLYFYGNPNFEKAINEHLAVDSVMFKRTEFGVNITYAPPWLVPAHLKLDYDILWFRIQSVGQEFMEVTVNETNGLTYFVDRFAGETVFWPEFFLSVYAVELRSDIQQTVRVKPHENAAEIRESYDILQPIQVRGDWIKVILKDEQNVQIEKGWVRWRNANELLIRWSLLS